MTDSSRPDTLQGFVDAHFPAREGVCLLAGEVADYADELYPEELVAVASAVAKRQREFATGRYLARKAMEQLGIARGPVVRDEDRRPIWPADCLGSISHTNVFALAAVAREQACKGVGVDLEEGDRVVTQLHDKLFTAWERSAYPQGDPRWPGLLFSAKEAGYKAVNPVVGRFIGFQEVEVDVDWARNRFTIRYVGEHQPNKLIDSGSGYFGFFRDHVISLFVIP